MDKEEIKKLHPDYEIALEVAVDMLSSALADTRNLLNNFIQYSVVTPSMVHYKDNCRFVFERTSDKAMLEQHPNVG